LPELRGIEGSDGHGVQYGFWSHGIVHPAGLLTVAERLPVPPLLHTAWTVSVLDAVLLLRVWERVKVEPVVATCQPVGE
jgi:hypothetical protein